MTQEIESVRPILTVIDDEGDLVISSTGPRGKEMAQAVLSLANGSRKVVVVQDGEMKVLKRGPADGQKVYTAAERATMAQPNPSSIPPSRRVSVDLAATLANVEEDVQDQFAADLAAGRTGEQAMGEQPSPTPGPNDPVKVPAVPPSRREPVIFQDAAAPPSPELAEAEMARLLKEVAEAEQAAAQVAEDQRYQRQQAVQAQVEPSPEEAAAEAATPPAPRRRREPRTLAVGGRPCGRCGGGGQIVGDSGFAGACPVCGGEGQVKAWDRSLKVR
jgi:hypothetical protein